jgi:hypothetical protein
MDVARQTNPHLEGCEEGGRRGKKKEIPFCDVIVAAGYDAF